MKRIIEYKIKKNEEGIRVSGVLLKHRFSRQNVAKLKWQENSVFLDEKPVRMNQWVKEGQILRVVIAEEKASNQIIAKKLPFSVVYEDEDLLVVCKPAGMPSQPSWYYEETSLASAAAYYWNEKGWSPFVYRCVNRLDKDTSGLLILARNEVAGAVLNQMHHTGELVRTYYAIVENGETLQDEGCIDAPIGKDQKEPNRYQIDWEHGLHARTYYGKLQEKDNLAFVELRLETGRTHQIRVHMSSIGHPLIGDATYNPGNHTMSRQALHAGKLEFPHPITGEHMRFYAAIPEDMQDFLQ